jgi:MFS superfamily sulfate permease-like transporter
MPDWLAAYRKEWLKPDVVAGLTAAAVVIPKAMAYATIAGLPVQIGLYTAFVPMVIYAVLGTSRVRRSPLGEVLGQERMFFTLEQAVARYETQR